MGYEQIINDRNQLIKLYLAFLQKATLSKEEGLRDGSQENSSDRHVIKKVPIQSYCFSVKSIKYFLFKKGQRKG